MELAANLGITPTIVELDRPASAMNHLLGLPASDRSA